MRIPEFPDLHLTYCSNIHSGETWEEVMAQLQIYVPELKKRISADKPFGIGLRLSGQAANELSDAKQLETFKQWLDQNNLYIFTMNGFPYGGFHRQRVKEQVYAPDWSTKERLDYSRNLINILAELLPENMDGGISTVPISYKYWFANDEQREAAITQSCKNLAQIAADLDGLYQRTGKEIHLDIEPEPDCILENTQETIDFFNQRLIPEGGNWLADHLDISIAEAEDILRRHITVCYDTCHFAVEYEDPIRSVQQFEEAGIRIGKVQISAALKVALNQEKKRDELKEQLNAFVESTYLHQVVERRTNGDLRQYRDLGEALPHIAGAEAEEWRIHFHVPVFTDTFDGLASTRDHIMPVVQQLLKNNTCHHYEIETYTWEVLPESLKQELTDSIEQEIRWVTAAIRTM